MLLRIVSLWLALLVGGAAGAADDFAASGRPAPEWSASIVTFQPGPVYWERFGHDAILLRNATTGEALTFNYGLFDFGQKDFFLNFARGRMRYLVAPNLLERDLPIYAEDGRWAIEQKLELTPEQVGLLRDFLIWNVQKAHAEYDYDYFRSNCATRVRDALDRALGGSLRAQLEGHGTGRSYRDEALRLIAPERPLFIAMDLALGPTADRAVDAWALGFSPVQLMNALRGATVPSPDGTRRPLVREEKVLLPVAGMPDPPLAAPDLRAALFALGALLALTLLALQSARAAATARLAFAVLATLTTLAFALAGLGLAGIWGLTEHWAGWRNGNLLLFDPLALLLLPAWISAARRHWQPSAFAQRLAALIALLALAEGALRLTPMLAQQNLHWWLLAAPVQAALWWSLVRQRRAADAKR